MTRTLSPNRRSQDPCRRYGTQPGKAAACRIHDAICASSSWSSSWTLDTPPFREAKPSLRGGGLCPLRRVRGECRGSACPCSWTPPTSLPTSLGRPVIPLVRRRVDRRHSVPGVPVGAILIDDEELRPDLGARPMGRHVVGHLIAHARRKRDDAPIL